MTNSISIYNFNQFSIRTQNINNEPYFCLADACSALGLSNSRKSKTQLSLKGVTKSYILTEGGEQELTFINEPNLYRLIFRSNKPQAQAFADWVYSEVLPSVRKTGGYGAVAQVDMKAIGGMVKKCCAVAVREELTKALSDDFETQNWLEIMCHGLKMRTDNLVKQRHADLISENEELKLRLNNIKLLAN